MCVCVVCVCVMVAMSLTFDCILIHTCVMLCTLHETYYRGNQHVKLKLKIPKTITPRQREIIEEFENPTATHSSSSNNTDKQSTADAKGNCNSTFTIEQAWKRVKDYWNSTGKKASGDDTVSKNAKQEAKA